MALPIAPKLYWGDNWSVPKLRWVVLLGSLIGAVGSTLYFIPPLSSLGHTVQLWSLLVVLVSRGRRVVEAAIVGATTLVASVFTFFIWKPIFALIVSYDIPTGFEYTRLISWVFLGLVAGGVLGAVASLISRQDWKAGISAGIFVGAQWMDAITWNIEHVDVVVWIAAGVSTAIIIVVGRLALLWTVTMSGAAVGVAFLLAPYGFWSALLP